MSRQKITLIPNENKQEDEILVLLEKLEMQYKQQKYICNHYRKMIWGKNQNKDTLLFCISGFLADVEQSLNAVESTEKALELDKKKCPNALLLLKIKLMILIARINLIITDIKPERIENALEIFSVIMLELTKHAKNLQVKKNSIQKELAYALRAIAIYGHANKLSCFNANQWMTAQWLLMKQYDNGFDKLESYKGNFDLTTNNPLNFPIEKREFQRIYEAMDKDYALRFKKNELTLEEKLDYLKASFLLYDISIKNHPTIKKTTFTNYNGIKKQPIEPLIHFFNVFQKEYENYVPKIDAIRKAMCNEALLDDLNVLFNFQYLLPDFYKFIQDQLTDLLFIYNYLTRTNETNLKDRVFNFIIIMRQFLIEFHDENCKLNDKIQDELTGFDLFKTTTEDNKLIDYIENKFLDKEELVNFKTLHCVSKEKLQLTQTMAVKLSNDHMNQLTFQTPKPNKKSKPPKKPALNISTTPEKKQNKTKEILPSISQSKQYLEQGSLMLSNKDYEKAYLNFDLAVKFALNDEEKLNALDGLLFSVQQDVMVSLNTINLDYDFTDSKLASTAHLIAEGIKNLFYLDLLYKDFQQTQEKITLKEKQMEIAYGQTILRQDYLKIKEKINQLHLMKDQRLAEMNKTNKPKRKALTNKTLKSKATLVSESKKLIHAIDFPPLQHTTPKEVEIINEPYAPKAQTVDIPSMLKDVFDFLNTVEGDHYLVGSMVLHLLLKESKNTIEPSDLDCLSLRSKSEDWIKNGHFMQITEEKHLFKLTSWCEFKPILPLEVWLEDEKDSLTECLLARDFTVCALACTSEGIVFDPTGYGFADLENRRLRMIGLPKERFQQSPSILLRVLKYMMLGFTPDDCIIKAMHAWQPTEETNKSQLHALCAKIFGGCDKFMFVDLLKQHQLLPKLFDKPCSMNTNDVLLFLENNLLNKSSKNKNNFFSVKSDAVETEESQEKNACHFT